MAAKTNKKFLPAITINQPFATAIAIGAKRYETRSWAPNRSFVGQRIAIHAGRCRKLPEKTRGAWLLQEIGSGIAEPLPRGSMLCTAMLAGAFRVGRSASGMITFDRWVKGSELASVPRFNQLDLQLGDFSPGRWIWQLTDVCSIEPNIACLGNQKIWKWWL